MFGFDKGFRFDSNKHEWLFLNKFILLPFSYMTFIIRQKFKDQRTWKLEDYEFDIEQYNFIYDHKSFFTLDEKVCLDHDQLKYILQNFKRTDPILLELLQYYSNP